MRQAKLVVPAMAGESGRALWQKKEGDPLRPGDVVLEVDLDFLKVPVRSPRAGTLAKIVVHEGHDASGGMTVALIDPSPEQELVARPKRNLEVCASCGVLRAERAVKCGHCGAEHGSRARVVEDDGWVCLACTFRCRACAFDVPLNHLDMDGGVTCAKCGLEQAFEVRAWHDAFDFAHGIADGALDSGRRTIATENGFAVEATAGRPLCTGCHELLDVAIAAERATARCPKCDRATAYVTPTSASKMTRHALRAILADEHRAESAVRVDAGAAVAITCPSCSAKLDADAETKFVTCKYCGTTSRIPDNVWFRLKGGEPRPAPMWLQFRGDSRARRDAEKEREEREHAELVDRIKENKQKRTAVRAEEHRKAREEAERRERRERDAEQRIQTDARQRKNDADRYRTFLIAALVIAGAIAFALIDWKYAK